MLLRQDVSVSALPTHLNLLYIWILAQHQDADERDNGNENEAQRNEVNNILHYKYRLVRMLSASLYTKLI